MIIQIILNLKNVTMNVSIFITGSNSKVLSGDLSTHLAGRYINIKMMPFTFSEYLELQNSQGIIKDKDEAFLEYVEWGGCLKYITLQVFKKEKCT